MPANDVLLEIQSPLGWIVTVCVPPVAIWLRKQPADWVWKLPVTRS
jgi:hypothetical protein